MLTSTRILEFDAAPGQAPTSADEPVRSGQRPFRAAVRLEIPDPHTADFDNAVRAVTIAVPELESELRGANLDELIDPDPGACIEQNLARYLHARISDRLGKHDTAYLAVLVQHCARHPGLRPASRWPAPAAGDLVNFPDTAPGSDGDR